MCQRLFLFFTNLKTLWLIHNQFPLIHSWPHVIVICVTLNTHVATILPPPLAEGGKDQRICPHSRKTTRLHISTTGEMTKILKDILKQQQQV